MLWRNCAALGLDFQTGLLSPPRAVIGSVPIASDDAEAAEMAEPLIRDIGYEPVLVGGLEMGKYLMPGTPLAGEHTPDGIREIVETLE